PPRPTLFPYTTLFRSRSLPMSRAAVLGGRTLADIATNSLSITVLLVTGVIIGFSFHTSFAHAAAGVALLLLFGYAFSWFLAFLRSEEHTSELQSPCNL